MEHSFPRNLYACTHTSTRQCHEGFQFWETHTRRYSFPGFIELLLQEVFETALKSCLFNTTILTLTHKMVQMIYDGLQAEYGHRKKIMQIHRRIQSLKPVYGCLLAHVCPAVPHVKLFFFSRRNFST
jgi:hypothetical protein